MVDIPNLPGVPQLPSYAPNNVILLAADVIAAFTGIFGSQWAVLLNGAQGFPYNSILDFDYKKDAPTSDYQLEDGGFQSYDKVELPFDVKVRLVSGPSEAEREALITAVRAAEKTLDLYTVVTPEQTYESCNVTHSDMKRTAVNGVGMVVIDVWFVEIRITSTSTFNNTQQPGIAGQQNTGNVSPQTPSAQVQQSFDTQGAG